MAWEENSRICINMQLIAILSRTGVIRFHVGSDFEADEPNGLYVFDAEDCIESSCFENEDESLSYDININDKVVERFCVDSIESYYNIELYYCDEDFVVVG